MTTNYERIKNMTVEEMAALFAHLGPKGCGMCMGNYMGCLREVSCASAIKEWLISNRPPLLINGKYGWLQAESEER